jgi:hypothetical protein
MFLQCALQSIIRPLDHTWHSTQTILIQVLEGYQSSQLLVYLARSEQE